MNVYVHTVCIYKCVYTYIENAPAYVYPCNLTLKVNFLAISCSYQLEDFIFIYKPMRDLF